MIESGFLASICFVQAEKGASAGETGASEKNKMFRVGLPDVDFDESKCPDIRNRLSSIAQVREQLTRQMLICG